MAAHRYWRVLTRRIGSGSTSCVTLEMATSLGGATVCTGGTPFADSEYPGGYGADKAFDGNSGTLFSSNTSSGFLGYDFGPGNAQDIVQVRWTARNDGFHQQSPYEGQVEWSDDGTTYFTAIQIYNPAGFSSGQTKSWNVQVLGSGARYWAMRAQPHLYNELGGVAMQLRFAVAGSNIAVGGTASSATEYPGGFGPSNLFDNNLSTLYSGNFDFFESARIGYDFGVAAAATVNEFVWTARSDGLDYNQSPKYGWIDFSNDGESFGTYWQFNNLTAYVAGESRTFTNPSIIPGGVGQRRHTFCA